MSDQWYEGTGADESVGAVSADLEGGEVTLVTVVRQWAAGEITLDEAIERADTLDFPVRKEADDGHWYDGNIDNTLVAVQAKVGEYFTFDQFIEFSERFIRR